MPSFVARGSWLALTLVAVALVGCGGDPSSPAGDAAVVDVTPDVPDVPDVPDAPTSDVATDAPRADAPPADAAASDVMDASDSGTPLSGERLVGTRGCTTCHQSDDPADGVMSGQIARGGGSNLTPDDETGLGRWTEEQIVRAIRDGVDDEGRTLCDTMPRYTRPPEPEIRAIVGYLRSLPPVHRVIPAALCDTP